MGLSHWFKSCEIPLIIRYFIVLVSLYLDRATHLLRVRNTLIILIPQVAALIINNNKRIVDRNWVILILFPLFFCWFWMMRKLHLITVANLVLFARTIQALIEIVLSMARSVLQLAVFHLAHYLILSSISLINRNRTAAIKSGIWLVQIWVLLNAVAKHKLIGLLIHFLFQPFLSLLAILPVLIPKHFVFSNFIINKI